jgi:hypothetical protein
VGKITHLYYVIKMITNKQKTKIKIMENQIGMMKELLNNLNGTDFKLEGGIEYPYLYSSDWDMVIGWDVEWGICTGNINAQSFKSMESVINFINKINNK